jgi:SnoaL-like domain
MEAQLERHPLRVAFEARDLQGVAEALAPDVVLHSPITSSFRFVGRDEVAALLGIVRQVFEDLNYLAEFGEDRIRVLVLRARVNGQQLEGTDILRLDEQGRVSELKVFIRPLPGLTALAAALAPRLARDTGWARSAAVAGMTRPFAAITRLGDVPGSRLAMGKVWATPS